MSEATFKRNKVISISDITSGCGMGISLKEALTTGITLGTNLSATFNNTDHITIRVSPTIAFEAGYEINANYLLCSKSSDVDISSMESVIDYIKNGEFAFSIEYTHPDNRYSDNWSINIHEEDLLNEIKEVAGEDEWDDAGYGMNEAFSFAYELTCDELSEDLLFNLTPTYSTKTHGLTADFAQHVHDELRKSAVEFYKKRINK